MEDQVMEKVKRKYAPGRKTATTTQIIAIAKLLQDNVKALDDGHVAYLSGWSDDVIAKKVGCAKSSVAKVRSENFGNLRSISFGPKIDKDLAARVAKLERFLVELGYNPDA